jgi:hypothetical protein
MNLYEISVTYKWNWAAADVRILLPEAPVVSYGNGVSQ